MSFEHFDNRKPYMIPDGTFAEELFRGYYLHVFLIKIERTSFGKRHASQFRGDSLQL